MSKQFWIDQFAPTDSELQSSFLNLNITDCKSTVEEIGFSSASGVSYDSAENRVFGFDEIVVKFYRPGRWSKEAIEEEFVFLKDLQDHGVSFVRPIGEVGTWKGLNYIVYERVARPYVDDRSILDEESVKRMVHTVAQIHKVGAKREASHRPFFNPKDMGEGCFEVIQRAGFLPTSQFKRYEDVISELVRKVASFGDIPIQRIHGDTYSGNVLWKGSHPIFMDLDDFQVGPVAIDVKLLSFPWRLDSLSEQMDRRERRAIQNEMVLKFYREVNDFPKEWEKLFPLLSVYRDIQFDAWFSARWNEPGFAKNYEDDDITQESWWLENLEGLEDLLNS
ncbi:conserved hypothetical protein [Halobacteriovorax marinus SJ]|uniref:Aminoglycoside phosphotransferase domain-containing protein n=1 Tax=Halobacteriovorax marinus (strain ATCC BAA-682 / DSM 15412 / SJ) TaxID=862908 RepID=E1WYH3_HALMS|nr:phosphotransferase [Halobacteriovorax marinus]CBW26021.1 conserved hypothetical protein [Halobacteriovorax marinus SJ]